LGKFYEGVYDDLSLHVRQLAWLHTAPTPKTKPGRKPPTDEQRMTRLQTLQLEGLDPSIPDAGVAAYLVKYLFEVGPTLVAGMGRAPISWAEISAWMHSTGQALQTWESTMLRRLSGDYLATTLDAADPAFPAPFSEQPTPDQRKLVSQKIRTALKGWSAPTRGQ
jgi:hypothetical protein